jgi:hypothetical protein
MPSCFCKKCKVLDCDHVGLQETRSSGRTEFAAPGYRVFFSRKEGSSGRPEQYRVGLVVEKSIILEVTWTQEFVRMNA